MSSDNKTGEAADSSDLEGQMQGRTQLAESLRAQGTNPYANDFPVSHAIAGLPRDVAALGPEDTITADAPRYAVAGRLVQVNEMGKARFLFLRGDRGEMLQLCVKADN